MYIPCTATQAFKKLAKALDLDSPADLLKSEDLQEISLKVLKYHGG